MRARVCVCASRSLQSICSFADVHIFCTEHFVIEPKLVDSIGREIVYSDSDARCNKVHITGQPMRMRARSYAWTMAALETGLERKADGVFLKEPPGERGGVGITHSAYDITKRKRVLSAVRNGSGLVTDKWTDLSKGANDDIIVIVVERRGAQMTRMINISIKETWRPERDKQGRYTGT